nr:hypothetical protein [Treponema sp.]
MTKNAFSIFLLAAFSVSLFLLVSCATTFPAHEIHPDFECADSDREPIVISGTLKSKPLSAPSDWTTFLADMFLLRSESMFDYNGTVCVGEERTNYFLKIMEYSPLFADDDGERLTNILEMDCGKIKYVPYGALANKKLSPLSELGYFWIEGQKFFVYASSKDKINYAEAEKRPMDVIFEIENENSDSKITLFSRESIMDTYRFSKMKSDSSDSESDREMLILAGITASFYKSSLHIMSVKEK